MGGVIVKCACLECVKNEGWIPGQMKNYKMGNHSAQVTLWWDDGSVRLLTETSLWVDMSLHTLSWFWASIYSYSLMLCT
jgi:hypothetical protein